jgi:hypothetical protein
MPKQRAKRFMSSRTCFLLATTLMFAVSSLAASAADTVPPDSATFGNRTDRPDGSAAMTIGRRLPTEWETKVGADFNLAAPPGAAATDNMTRDLGQSHHGRGTADRPGQGFAGGAH